MTQAAWDEWERRYGTRDQRVGGGWRRTTPPYRHQAKEVWYPKTDLTPRPVATGAPAVGTHTHCGGFPLAGEGNHGDAAGQPHSFA